MVALHEAARPDEALVVRMFGAKRDTFYNFNKGKV